MIDFSDDFTIMQHKHEKIDCRPGLQSVRNIFHFWREFSPNESNNVVGIMDYKIFKQIIIVDGEQKHSPKKKEDKSSGTKAKQLVWIYNNDVMLK